MGQETRAIDRPTEHTRSGDLIVTQGADECCGHPMTIWHGHDEALPARRPAMEPHHVGLRSRFINEDKMFRVQIGLANTPLLARLGNIGVVLFGGTQ
jgi:hypothetical protein